MFSYQDLTIISSFSRLCHRIKIPRDMEVEVLRYFSGLDRVVRCYVAEIGIMDSNTLDFKVYEYAFITTKNIDQVPNIGMLAEVFKFMLDIIDDKLDEEIDVFLYFDSLIVFRDKNQHTYSFSGMLLIESIHSKKHFPQLIPNHQITISFHQINIAKISIH